MNAQEIKDRLSEIEVEKARMMEELAQISKWTLSKSTLCWVSDVDKIPSSVNPVSAITREADGRFYRSRTGATWKYATPLTRDEALALIDEPKKPSRYDWSKIPKEYEWAATDLNGAKYVFRLFKPHAGPIEWYSGGDWSALYLGCEENPCPDWRGSLEARPRDE